MAVYLVGNNNKTFFKDRTNWDFEAAYANASNGDVIEFEKGFSLFDHLEAITIDKDIELVGKSDVPEEWDYDRLPRIFIKNGAKVIVRNLAIVSFKEKTNCINMVEKTNLILENVRVMNFAETGENYPIVWLENSNIEMNEVFISESNIKDGNHQFFCKNGKIQLENSTVNARIQICNTELNCKNVSVLNNASNALYAYQNSRVNLEGVTLAGGKVLDKSYYSCVKIDDSSVTLKDARIIMSNHFGALCCKNSVASMMNTDIDSAIFVSSQVRVWKTRFMGSVAIEGGSKVSGIEGENKGSFSIMGKANGKINLFASEKSKIDLETIWFAQLSDPNIKLERNVKFEVENLFRIKYDKNIENLGVYDSENNPILLDEEIPPIVYFGKLTAYEELQGMIGLSCVKNEIDEFVALTQMNKLRSEKGLAKSDLTLHSLFLGNPGTGKTTVARILGSLLYEKGIISTDKYIETSRSDLVGQYIGETAIKTREVLESALGGVLFIDEAYTLASEDNGKDFGIEAINEILKFMEDHRDNIVIIFAGYTKEMDKFLKMNEGLRSRIPNKFNFEDYTITELTKIGLNILRSQNFQVDEEAYGDLVQNNFELSNDNSNGRWIRNLNESLLRKHAVSLSKNPSADLSLISNEVIASVKL